MGVAVAISSRALRETAGCEIPIGCSSGENRAEGADFFVDGGIRRIVQGVGDLGAQGDAEAVAETEQGLTEGSHASSRGRRPVSGLVGATRSTLVGSERAQGGEDGAASVGAVFRLDAEDGGPPGQRSRPDELELPGRFSAYRSRRGSGLRPRSGPARRFSSHHPVSAVPRCDGPRRAGWKRRSAETRRRRPSDGSAAAKRLLSRIEAKKACVASSASSGLSPLRRAKP